MIYRQAWAPVYGHLSPILDLYLLFISPTHKNQIKLISCFWHQLKKIVSSVIVPVSSLDSLMSSKVCVVIWRRDIWSKDLLWWFGPYVYTPVIMKKSQPVNKVGYSPPPCCPNCSNMTPFQDFRLGRAPYWQGAGGRPTCGQFLLKCLPMGGGRMALCPPLVPPLP